jgi:hypothetical protein
LPGRGPHLGGSLVRHFGSSSLFDLLGATNKYMEVLVSIGGADTAGMGVAWR